MSSHALYEAIRELMWSVFTELGIPGVARHHQRVAIDPEPFVVAAPSIFEIEPRLRDQVYCWCRAHAGRLSVSRIQGLLRELPESGQQAFASFAATLRRDAKVRWPTADAEPWPRSPAFKAPKLPLDRPSLLRLRLRALCGVGARADVLAELLGRADRWTLASDLAREGYSKRGVAGILSELSEAGLVSALAERNALKYRLRNPDLVAKLASGRSLAFPAWRRVTGIVLLMLELAALEAKPPAVRRVEADRLSHQLRPLAEHLVLEPPPSTRGNPHAWEDTLIWAVRSASSLADGTASVFRAGS